MYQRLEERAVQPDLEFDDRFIKKLYRILHIKRGSKQQNGEYPGRFPVYLTAGNSAALAFDAHIRGEHALAFNVVHRKRKVNFLCFDMDAEFPKRLKILARVLEQMGLASASFATNGSSFGKGKVIVTFVRPMSRAQAEKIRDEIIDKATLLGLECTKENKVDVFPTDGEGGLVRILGRNVARNGPVEIPLNLRGEPTALDYLQPLQFEQEKLAVPKARISPWVLAIVKSGIKKNASRNYVRDKVIDLARDAVRIENGMLNKGAAWDLFTKWLHEVALLSTWLQEEGNESKLELLNPESKEVERFFNYALSHDSNDWKPIHLLESKNPKSHAKCYVQTIFPKGKEGRVLLINLQLVPQLTTTPEMRYFSWGAGQVYKLMLNLINQQVGLNRLSYSIDTERVADHLGMSQQRASVIIKDAVKQGLLVVVEPGRKHAKGVAGCAATYALVGVDEDPEELYDRARAHYEERNAKLLSINSESNNISTSELIYVKSTTIKDIQQRNPSWHQTSGVGT